MVDALVSLTDLAPTLLASAGLKAPEAMTGRTLVPLLRGETQAGRDHAFIERERHANVRPGDASYPIRGGADERLSVYPELPRRPLARPATRSNTSRWPIR